MKYIFAITGFIFPLLIGTIGNKNVLIRDNEASKINVEHSADSMSSKIRIKVGDKIFIATLLDNLTVKAFKALLPMTINMTELNGNEKYFRLPNNLPNNASKPGTIHSGDLKLWGSDTFVIFYQSFSTSYSYTTLGKIENSANLAVALGSGNVIVTIELE